MELVFEEEQRSFSSTHQDFHKSRIGVLLAYAMMMTIICHFNSNDPHSRRAIHRPISSSSGHNNIIELEKMGIMDMDDKNDD